MWSSHLPEMTDRRFIRERDQPRQLALVLAGGGARAAYQAGVVCYMRELAPEIPYSIITGVSAGAINAAFLAGHPGRGGAEALVDCWKNIDQSKVYDTESSMRLVQRMLPMISLGNTMIRVREGEALLNTSPLRRYLSHVSYLLPRMVHFHKIQKNLDEGQLASVCITTTSFTTGQSVSWVEGRDIQTWQRPESDCASRQDYA